LAQAVECLPSKHKALNSNPSTTKKKIKITLILSIDVEKSWENSISLYDKSPEEKNALQRDIKGTCDKPIANIMPNGEKLKAFPLKSGTRQGCWFSLFLFNIVMNSYPDQ
jgi:hypothetical protein